jgi:CMP/dCMP kinase
VRTSDGWLRTAVHRLLLQVAIDGPAGSGKSTVGLGLAERLSVPLLDTGLMYRAVTWLSLRDGIPSGDDRALIDLASRTHFDIDSDGRGLLLNGAGVGPELQSRLVDAAVSAVSAHAAVRAILVRHQREIADERAIVMVGRDIGTVVLPDAPVKLWITATPRTRAERRVGQRVKPEPVDQIEAEIASRDHADATRAASPLVRAPDALVLPTDADSPHETIRRALEIVATKAQSLVATER